MMMNYLVHTLPLRLSNAFLIESEDGLVLVDAGSPGDAPRIMSAVRALGKPLRLVFITHAHFDHYGSANAVRTQSAAPLAVHAADADAMTSGLTPIRSAHGRGRLTLPFTPLMALWRKRLQTPADLVLEDGDRLEAYGLPAYLLHTPGHTPGSSCLVLENGQHLAEAAFVGDLLTAGRQPALQRLYADDWQQLGASLARLQALEPARTYAAHGHGSIEAAVLLKIKP